MHRGFGSKYTKQQMNKFLFYKLNSYSDKNETAKL